MGLFKGLQGMRPLRPSVTDRNIYAEVPEANLEAQLEHMKQIPKEVEAPKPLTPRDPLPEGAHPLGLRIDVATHDGMREGLPRLLDALAASGVHATVFAALGPDRTGLRLAALLRSKVRPAYTARTLLSGLLLPPRPVVHEEVARRVRAEGHALGVLGWDPAAWTTGLNRKMSGWAPGEMERAFDAYAGLFSEKPRAYAAPGWLCNNDTLIYQENLGLEFASDCRGMDPFLPVIDVRVLRTPQVPVTMPTLAEGLDAGLAPDPDAFFAQRLEECGRDLWPALAVSAEVEGRLFPEAFVRFLALASQKGVCLMPLHDLLAHREATGRPLPRCTLSYAAVDGRPGVVSMQMFEV